MSDVVQISLSDALSIVTKALQNAGVSESVAASVAQGLVAAEAEGQVGHGLTRLSDYVAQVHSGKINLNANITVASRGPASLCINADEGFAYPALDIALAKGIPLAKKMGICVVAVANSHHCGALSVQVERIAKEGLIGLMFANTPKAIAPWGGREPILGTNPIAFSAPRNTPDPLIIDLSLSKVARGKIMAAKKLGQSIPSGWALDVDGKATTDPEKALDGTMIPIGQAKGTALALMVEILSAVFSGSALSMEASSFFDADHTAPRVGQTMIMISPTHSSEFTTRIERLLQHIASLDGVRLPGSRRQQATRHAELHGILIPKSLETQTRKLAS